MEKNIQRWLREQTHSKWGRPLQGGTRGVPITVRLKGMHGRELKNPWHAEYLREYFV